MKKALLLIAMLVSVLGSSAQKPWTKGGFETRKYRNVFVENGYKKAQVEAKLK